MSSLPTDRRRKIEISLPVDLLAEVRSRRKATGETRQSLVRRAIEELLDRSYEADAAREYVEAYRRNPETPEEIAEMTPTVEELAATLRDYPWE